MKIYSNGEITEEISSFFHAHQQEPPKFQAAASSWWKIVQMQVFQLQLLLLLALGDKLQSMAEYSKPGTLRMNWRGGVGESESDHTISCIGFR